jgi:hypothetical protein
VWSVYGWLVVNWSWVVWSWVGFVNWGWLVVNWGRDRFVCWGWEWLIGWGWEWFVCGFWGRFVRGLVFWVDGFSFVSNVGNISIWSSRVGDNLDTAIWKVYTVFTLGIVVISVFAMGKGWSISSSVIYAISEVVYWSSNRLDIWGWSMVWCWSSRSSGSACYQCGSGYKNLEKSHRLCLV